MEYLSLALATKIHQHSEETGIYSDSQAVVKLIRCRSGHLNKRAAVIECCSKTLIQQYDKENRKRIGYQEAQNAKNAADTRGQEMNGETT